MLDTPLHHKRSDAVKPAKWDHWNTEKRKAFALCLVEEPRGHYLLARALYLAAHELGESDPSDAQDMELLGKTLFGPYWEVEEIAKELSNYYGKQRKTGDRRNASNSETVKTEDSQNDVHRR